MNPTSTRIAFLCLLCTLFSIQAYSQANCNNVDFEDGGFNNWQGFTGTCCPGDAAVANTPGIVNGQHTIMTGTGFDPIIPSIPVVSPFGGTYSVRLGNSTTGADAERLRYDFQVTAQNPNFTYQYAVILQDPGHPEEDQPRFVVNILNQNNQLIPCGEYDVKASAGIPGFQDNGAGVVYKEWSLVAVDLSNYIGQTVIIDFKTGDCDLGGHYGYAYIDASCNPLQISSNYCPGDPVGTLTAPAGFQSYTWSTGQTTQSITINSPNPGDTVTVICAPYQGNNCSSKLQYVFLQSPPVDANFTVDLSCGNSAIVLTDSSTIVANNAQITGWEWIVNNQVVSTTSSFTYDFPGPGNYDITIIAQSNAGCPDTLTKNVFIPQGLDAVTATPSTSNYNGYGVSCPGATNGIVSVTASYGTPPYTYAWNTNPVATGTTVSNLPAGTYIVTVTESGGCQAIDTAVLTEPDSIVIAPQTQDVQCYGETNGSIDLNPSGGVLTLSYQWQHNTSLNTPSASGLTGGSYAFTITDANGCTFDSVIIISGPAAPFAYQSTITNATCYNGCDGSIDLHTVTGNTPPYTYAWSTIPPQTAAIATQLCASAYTVTVTDINNCTGSVSYTVTEPAQMQLGLTKTDLLCNGDNSGTAASTVSGGTTPYTYIWSDPNSSSTPSVTGLAAGSYTLTVYDNLQCSATDNITLTEPTVLQVSATHQDVACFGGSTGRVFGVAQGGTTPYTYAWSTSPVQTGATANNVPAGTYTVVVRDNNNCTASVSEPVNEPTQLTATISNTVDNICYDGATGQATVTAGGGSLPYLYNWATNPAQTTPTATGLRAGQYNVTVTDDSLCTAITTATINQPTQMQVVPTLVNALCYDSTQASVSLAVTQGTPGSGTAYTYNWNPGGWGTETASNLLAGTYNVTVYDANQCWEARSYTVTQPPQLSISTTHLDASCYSYSDGRIVITAGGGTPIYTYSVWENGSQVATNTNGTFNGLPLGNYVAQYADANNCIINTPVSIQQPTELLVQSISADSVNCYGYSDGSISVTATGSVPPYTYTINNAISNGDGQFSGLTQGTYNVVITDDHNCSVTTTAIVNEPYLQVLNANPDSLSLILGQTKPIAVTSNYDPNTLYNWSTWQGLDCQNCPNVNVTLYENYIYTVTVTAHPHDLDCETTITIPVTVIPNYDVFIPNAFTPNGDGNNDYFEFYGNKPAIKQMQVQIFNRIGEKIYESNDLNFKWDGHFKGVLQNPAVYVYVLNLVFYDNHVENSYRGSFTLIR